MIRLVIIGVGLIGGSLALALRQAGAYQEIIGSGRNEAELQKAVSLGVIDRYVLDAGIAVRDADMVVIAVPVGAIEAVFRQIQGRLAVEAVCTDVGSTKGSVIDAAQRVFQQVPNMFVPGHPIAGTEQSGVEAARSDLFRQRRVVLTPLPDTNAVALHRVRSMWECTGAEVVETGVQHHDEVLAATSHLPHLLAYALVDTLARMDSSEEIFRFAAGGFRDFTRIAASSPQMWHDICLANRSAILGMLDRFSKDLAQLATAIDSADSDGMLAIFQRAKTARDRLDDSRSPVPE